MDITSCEDLTGRVAHGLLHPELIGPWMFNERRKLLSLSTHLFPQGNILGREQWTEERIAAGLENPVTSKAT